MGILTRLLDGGGERRALELRDPALIKLFDMFRTRSGMNVTPDTAMTLSSVYLAVKILAEAIATLPMHLFRRLEDGGKERMRDHALDDLLSRRPNRWQTPFEFKEMMMAHLVLRGDGIAEKVATGGSSVTELIPLHPDHVRIRRAAIDVGGQVETTLIYEHRPVNGPARVLFQGEVMHWRGLGFDGIRGFSPITVQRETIGNAMAVEAYGQTFFGNSAIPATLLSHPGNLTQEAQDRLKKNWNKEYGGADRAGGTAVVEEGMQYQQLGLSNDDAQFLDSRKFNVVDIARIFNIPPHMLMEMGRATFNNIEQMSLSFVVNSLLPWVIRIEQATARDLLTETVANHRAGRLFIAFLLEQRMRGDFKSRNEGYRIGRQWGWLSANDIRKLENMNPIADDFADDYLIPLNMVPASAAADMFGAGGDDEANAARALLEHVGGRIAKARANVARAHLPLLHDFIGRMVRAQSRDIRAAVRRILSDGDAATLRGWIDTYFRDAGERTARTIEPVAATFARSLVDLTADESDTAPIDGERLALFVRDFAADFARRFNASAADDLAAALDLIEPNAIAEAVEAVLSRWDGADGADSRATETARNAAARLMDAPALAPAAAGND